MLRYIFYLFLILSSCSESKVDPFDLIPSLDAQNGTIMVDPPDSKGGKEFQGVWFITTDGTKKLVSYSTRSVWAQFDGKAVTVTGESYFPQGQSIVADHFRITRLKLQKTNDAALYVSVGPETKMHGTMQLSKGEAGHYSV